MLCSQALCLLPVLCHHCQLCQGLHSKPCTDQGSSQLLRILTVWTMTVWLSSGCCAARGCASSQSSASTASSAKACTARHAFINEAVNCCALDCLDCDSLAQLRVLCSQALCLLAVLCLHCQLGQGLHSKACTDQGSSQQLCILTVFTVDRLAQPRVLCSQGLILGLRLYCQLCHRLQHCIQLFDCGAERMLGSAQDAVQTGAGSPSQSSASTARSDKTYTARQASL